MDKNKDCCLSRSYFIKGIKTDYNEFIRVISVKFISLTLDFGKNKKNNKNNLLLFNIDNVNKLLIPISGHVLNVLGFLKHMTYKDVFNMEWKYLILEVDEDVSNQFNNINNTYMKYIELSHNYSKMLDHLDSLGYISIQDNDLNSPIATDNRQFRIIHDFNIKELTEYCEEKILIHADCIGSNVCKDITNLIIKLHDLAINHN